MFELLVTASLGFKSVALIRIAFHLNWRIKDVIRY